MKEVVFSPDITRYCDVAIIGGGAAGMAAAVAAHDAGAKDVLILEIKAYLGGVLDQCIHSGFGLHTFNEELTGPEYSARLEEMVRARGIRVMTQSPVMELLDDRSMVVVSRDEGLFKLQAKAVVIAMGCRERPAGAISIEGQRPAGVLTAGTAQQYINLDGYMVGRRAVILGSGDIGLIMARRLTLEGAEVLCVCELLPHAGGLNRNIVQCLDDFNIPLKLSTTVIGVEGRNRVEGVWIAPVDSETLRPITEQKEFLPCDTLLLSVGLIPETELAREAGAVVASHRGLYVDDERQTSLEGIFACGNVVHVHDIVDFAAQEGEIAGRVAAEFALGSQKNGKTVLKTLAGEGVSYIVPGEIKAPFGEAELSFRVRKTYRKAKIVATLGDRIVFMKRRVIMVPGEMEIVKVDLSGLEELAAKELTVSVDDGD